MNPVVVADGRKEAGQPGMDGSRGDISDQAGDTPRGATLAQGRSM